MQRPAVRFAIVVGSVLREARWLGAARALAWARVLAAVGALTVLGLVADTRGGTAADGWGRPLAPDFAGFWVAGRVALSRAPGAAWDPVVHAGVQERLFAARDGFAGGDCPFLYPPPFLLACVALALLPYWAAAGAWMLLTGAWYVAAMRAMLPRGWLGGLAAVAFPGVLVDVEYGQNGMLWAALLGTAATQLDRRPRLAGACLGLLCVKPPLAMLAGPALLAAGRVQALAWAAVSAGVVCLAAWAAFGGEAWRGFVGSAGVARAVLEDGLAGHGRMASGFAAARLLGAGVAAAWGVQGVACAVALAAVAWVGWRRPGGGAEVSVLAAAACLASPYLFDYDLMVVAVPLAWAGGLGARDGFGPWEKAVLAAAFVLPLVARPVAMGAGVPVAPVVLLALLGVLVRRAAGLPACAGPRARGWRLAGGGGERAAFAALGRGGVGGA